ncbi:MAG TPA: hypothetical protein VD838_07555 [Anaeromyxobacteraceae bacterium]|nr:hypothetical protein [Anaeromyxobacteraceae bacterium]
MSITYEMFGVPDRLDAYYNGVLVATTGGPVSGSGTLTFEYPALRRKKNLTITITGGSGTAWIYTVSCPVPPAPEP